MGHNELLLREALQGRRRDDVVISVKFGALRDAERRLQRLRLPAAGGEELPRLHAGAARHRPHRHLPARAPGPGGADRGDRRRDRGADRGRPRAPHRALRGRRGDACAARTPCTRSADLQIEYSLLSRGIEDDILPTAASWASASRPTACSRAGCSPATGARTARPRRATSAPSARASSGENLDQQPRARRGAARGRRGARRDGRAGRDRLGARARRGHRAAGRRPAPRPARRGARRRWSSSCRPTTWRRSSARCRPAPPPAPATRRRRWPTSTASADPLPALIVGSPPVEGDEPTIDAWGQARDQVSGSPPERRTSPSCSRWVSQARVIDSAQVAVASSNVVAGQAPREVEGGRPALGQRGADGLEALGDERAVGLDVAVDVGERAPVAGQREPRVEHVDGVQRGQELARPGRACGPGRSRARRGRAGGRRRSAAAARAGAGRRARARGRASRSPASRRGRSAPRRPARDRGRRPARRTIPLPDARRCSAQRRSGASGTPLWRATSSRRGEHLLGVVGQRGEVVAVAGGSTPPPPVRSRIAGAWPQWSTWACVQTTSRMCSRRRLAWSSARSRCAIEPGSCMPGVDQHDAVAGRERPGVAVRDPGPGQRQAQPPHAGQHALAAPHLALAGRLAHRGGR